MTPRLFITAGEPSGDRLGGALLAGLRTLAPEIEVRGIGGPAMAAEGLESQFPMQDLSVMGIAEVLPRLPLLLRRIRETAAAVAAWQPDALVTIDAPDFSLRVARAARKLLPGLRTIHYVAPTVWAWRPGRAAKMAEVVDHVLALLPFEPPYIQAAGMTCDFVGHPAATEPQATAEEMAALRRELAIAPTQPLLLLLPGSRSGEVKRLAPVFSAVARDLRRRHPDLAIVVPAAAPVVPLLNALLRPDDAGWPHILDPGTFPEGKAQARKRAAFATADLALAASGTVSLELAAADTPMVIAYDANPLTVLLVRRLIRIDTATLVNLVTDTRTVPEYLFDRCTPSDILPAVERLLLDPDAAAAQRAAMDRTMQLLGRGGDPPGLRAARSILTMLDPGPDPGLTFG